MVNIPETKFPVTPAGKPVTFAPVALPPTVYLIGVIESFKQIV